MEKEQTGKRSGKDIRKPKSWTKKRLNPSRAQLRKELDEEVAFLMLKK